MEGTNITIKSKKDKKPSGVARGGREISTKMSKEELKKAVARIAKVSRTYKEIMDEVEKQTGSTITKPTIGKYLKEMWGTDYPKKRAEMSKRKSLARKWKKDFESDRIKVKPIFRKDYISAGDGLYYLPDENKLIEMPSKESLKSEVGKPVVLNKAFYKRVEEKNKITFVKAGQFGYDDDKGEKATFDASIKPILMKQLKFKLKDDPEKDTKLEDLSKQIDKMVDSRSDLLFGPKILDRNLCPGWSTSNKTDRGKTRMLAMEGIDPETGKPYVFSRAVYNLPNLLHTHSKRIQILSHNASKEPATLLKSEEPIVEGRQNNIPGVNLRVRMPKNWREDLMTEESAVIISKAAAKKMKYFTVVETGSIIADSVDKLPDTYRSDKKVKNHEDIKDHLIKALDVRRGEPIIMNAIEGLEGSIAQSDASHSGKIILIGEPTEHIRNLTVDPDKDKLGRNVRTIRFYRQNYQIVREDELHRGDKILIRNGIKSVISDIRNDLGFDKKGRPIDLVVNYTDVWRKADPKDSDYALKEETFIRQGKKKSSVVLEHRDADGKMFTFIIDKFAQDEGSKQAMRISTTFVAGLWEIALSKILDKPRYTNTELKNATQRFVEHYIREPSTMITSLKALHYRFVEMDDGKIRIEADPNEPTEDKNGRILPLRHEANGRIYNNVYLPKFISRLYRDQRSCTADTVIPAIIDEKIRLMTIEDIFNLYIKDIKSDGEVEYIDLKNVDIKILSYDYSDELRKGAWEDYRFYNPGSIMRHKNKDKKIYLVIDRNAGIPCVTEDHSLMIDGEPIQPNSLGKIFNLDTIDEAFGKQFTFGKGCGRARRILKIDILPLLDRSKHDCQIEYDEKEVKFVFRYTETTNNGTTAGQIWKKISYPRYIKLDKDFGYISGLYIADGCMKSQSGMIASGCDWSIISKVKRSAEKIFGKENIRISSNIDKRLSFPHMIYTVAFTNQHGKGVFSNLFGVDTDKKHLPDNILAMSKEFVKYLIRGYLDGDGSRVHRDWHLRSGMFGTRSRVLASQLTFILKYYLGASNFRFNALINKYKNIEYRVEWNNDKILCKANNKSNDKLIEIDYDKYVYDFEVPETQTFVDALGGVVLHNTLRERFMVDLADEKPGEKVYQWNEIVRTIKNWMYIFPRIQESKDLVAIPYVDVKKPTDINTIKMDALDVAEAGGDPKDPNLMLSWRKEPVGPASIQTANVKVDFSGKYRDTIGIHVESAKKGILDYDGDQVFVFSPAISPAMIKPTDEEKKYLKNLRNKDYSQKTFESLYNEAQVTKYANSEKELGIKCAGYNQTIARLENQLIQELGGVRRSALLLYKSERPPKITIGEGTTKRIFELTPELVNKVCDVEKVLKMKEPYWKLQALYKKNWKDLTEPERDLVVDMHIRREIKRLTRAEKKDPNTRRLDDILKKEKTYFAEEGSRRDRKIDPIGLIIDPKSNRLLDQILWQQIKISGLEIYSEERE